MPVQSDLGIRRDSGGEQTTHNHQRLLTRRGTSTGAPSHPANILRQSVYSTHLHLRIYFKSTRLRLASTSTRLLQVNASTTSVYCCTGTRHGGKFLYAMSRDRQAIISTIPVIQSGSAASGRCAITRISDTELFRDLHQSTYGKFGISSRLAPTSSRQFQVNTPTSTSTRLFQANASTTSGYFRRT